VRAIAIAALSCVAALLAATLAHGQATPLDGIVAIVGGRTPRPDTDVVLRSDVELRARLSLAGRSTEIPSGPVPTPLLAATLEQIVSELLIAREAERLHAAEPTAEQIAHEREMIVESVGGEPRLARLIAALSVDPAEIDALAQRRAYVDAFLRANLEGSTLVSDAEVEAAYEGEHPFTDRPLDAVREALRAWLAANALERDVRRWIEVLRSRTPVRVVVPFAP
jgi:hypothetical protein